MSKNYKPKNIENQAVEKVGGILTAVREAAFSFQSPFFMESGEFKNLIERKTEISEKLDKLSEEIIGRLFALITKEKNEKTRQQLIVLKRSLFNRRNISIAIAEDLTSKGFSESRLDEYGKLLTEKNELFETYGRKILTEIEQCCNKILENEFFLTSLEYSCPELSLSRLRSPTKFSKWLRAVSTVYGYALKHITKSPPLITFSRIYLPASRGIVKTDTFETVLNVGIFSEIENSLTRSPNVESLLKFEMVTNWRSGSKHYFLVFRDNTVKILHYPATPILEKWVNYFNEMQSNDHPITRKNLFRLFSGDATEATSKLFEKLLQDGIFFSYLIENINSPAKNLIKSDPDHQTFYENLQKYDCHIFAFDRVLCEHRKITKDISLLEIKTSPPYIGYYYAGQITAGQRELADVFTKDLNIIADIFCADHNNSYNRMTLLGLIEKCFESSGKMRIPYLELLTRLMWAKVDENSGYQNRYRKSLREISVFQKKILEMNGHLTAENIAELTGLLPENAKQISGTKRTFPICFVGTVDFQTPSFYPHNVFSGNERFTGKYLMRQNQNRFEPDDDHGGTLNVEVLPIWNIPQHRVTRSLDTGFSFDRRSLQLFDESVAPEDIEVILQGKPVFIHRLTGKKLKFHYRGLALLQRLPIPYKILLYDQIDFFVNFFAQTPPPCKPDEIVSLEQLSYQSIVLRRSCFCIGIDLLKPYIMEKDLVRGAYYFRKYIKDICRFDSDYLYFRPVEKNNFTDTPRFLNLIHPLGWDIFRRSILKFPECETVHFTPCRPLPEQMFLKSDGNHFTEFMIEV